jgi:hypothetical protein
MGIPIGYRLTTTYLPQRRSLSMLFSACVLSPSFLWRPFFHFYHISGCYPAWGRYLAYDHLYTSSPTFLLFFFLASLFFLTPWMLCYGETRIGRIAAGLPVAIPLFPNLFRISAMCNKTKHSFASLDVLGCFECRQWTRILIMYSPAHPVSKYRIWS